MKKYVFASIGAVVLLILVGALLVINSKPKQVTPRLQAPQLVDYAGDSSVASVTTYGKLVGNDERRAIRVSISANERRLEVLNGYGQSVSVAKSYPNTFIAYQNFLSALDQEGFTSKKQTNIEDQRGACPTGKRYTYELTTGGVQAQSLWSVSCDATGTFAGRGAAIRQLFQRQIPDYDKQVANVKL